MPTITSLDLQQTGPGQGVLSWTSDGINDEFWIWKYEDLIGFRGICDVDRHHFDVTWSIGERPVFFVFTNPTETPADVFPDFAAIPWEALEGTSRYKIQQKIDGVFRDVGSITQSMQSYIEYITGQLEDDTWYEFRIIPVASDTLLEGNPRDVKFHFVRRPSTPSFKLAIEPSTGDIIMAA